VKGPSVFFTHNNDNNHKATLHFFTFSLYLSLSTTLYGNFILPAKIKPS